MKKSSFTLAEVLITLTIIGVIAALTIPNLMRKWTDHADVAKVKEAYSILSNATKMAIAENGQITDWEWPEPDTNYSDANEDYFAEQIAKHLKVKTFCGTERGCLRYGWMSGQAVQNANGLWKGISGSIINSSISDAANGKMILENGMRLSVAFYLPPTHPNNFRTASYILVDINGPKKPNQWGYDVFRFAITADGLGLIDKTRTVAQNCNPIVNTPQRDFDDGVSCAYWVIKHGNMDYKYRDISAEW